MQQPRRYFKGVWIPAEVWFSKEASPIEKMILTEINSLDGEDHCYASNKHFSEMFGISTRQVSDHISALAEKKLIKVEMIGRNKRVIMMEENLYQRWRKTSITDRGNPPHSNTVSNTLSITTGASAGKETAELIDGFRTVDPNWRRLFGRKNQREAVSRMLKQHGRQLLEKIITFLPRNNADPYAPKITTPIQLEENMGRMKAHWEQKKAKGQGIKVAFH